MGGLRERWKKVFYDYYEVSSYGRVRRIKNGSPNTYPGRILNPSKNSRYPLVVLYGPPRIKKTIRVHILVSRAFIGSCPPEKEVNHIDGDRWNCKLKNLEYTTPKGNGEHASKNGLVFNRSPLRLKDIKRIRNFQLVQSTGRLSYGIAKKLACEYQVSSGVISSIVHRRTWKWVA